MSEFSRRENQERAGSQVRGFSAQAQHEAHGTELKAKLPDRQDTQVTLALFTDAGGVRRVRGLRAQTGVETTTPVKSQGRANDEIDSLTALRGIAALWVVIYHYRSHSAGLPLDWLWRNGYLAVDIFFVLSGFIMIYVYGAAFQAGRFDYGAFLTRRFARLYPVHLVTTLVVAGLYLVSGSAAITQSTGDQIGSLWVNLAMLQAWNLTDALYLNYPSWSISAEFFAYVLFPVFAAIAFMVKRSWAAPLGLAMFVTWCLAYNLANGLPLFGSHLFRLTTDYSALRIVPEFLMGGLFAVAVAGTRWPGMRLLVAVMALQAVALQFGSEIAFVALVPVLIGALFNLRSSIPRALVYLGRISYSLYMVHAVVEKVVFRAARTAFHVEDGQFPVWSIAATVMLALGAAALTYHFVEKPGRRFVLGMMAGRRGMPATS